jgi:tRNA A37 threonylcarbamoyladenosine synthetase subunit TsaC/SUA5/YrdC
LAIWVNHVLCGLLIGRISDSRIVATIYYLEGRPVDNPLSGSVANIATRYVELLARLLHCKQAAIDSPLPALIDFYKRLGYSSATTKGRKVVRLVKTLSANNYPGSGG